ncbi:hypothetical protein YPPY42_4938, partial [Yersinia pestis PY-42]
MRLATAFTTE